MLMTWIYILVKILQACMIMEYQESYCIFPKSEDQLETPTLISLIYYASKLSEQHSEEYMHEAANKIRRHKNSYKNLVLYLASLKYKLRKMREREELLSSS